MASPSTLSTSFLFRVDIVGGTPNEIGQGPLGRRRMVPVVGGSFAGPKLQGEVLPFGGDVALVRADGVFEPDVNLVLRTADGSLIRMHYRGRWHAEPAVLERLLRREPGIAPSDYYFRTAVFFETAAPAYLWLNRLLAVGIGEPKPLPEGGIAYHVFAVE